MSNPVFVPIDLDIMLVNPGLLHSNTFRWWQYVYPNMNDKIFHSPEPPAFEMECSNIATGAYLHWNLPVSLRSGKSGSSSDFPLVPNRWLLVRVSKQTGTQNVQKAWVIESDCPVNGGNSSFYLVDDAVLAAWKACQEPNRNTAVASPISSNEPNSYSIAIGKSFPLETWSEKAANTMFLTAVAPGNTDFSAYVPHNQNIFSFYDDLAGVPQPSTISYFVTGWYSDLSKDIINLSPQAGATSNLKTILDALNWTLQGLDEKSSADSSMYTGMAFDLNWNASNERPTPQQDQLEEVKSTLNVTVAIANTGTDAFTSLVASQLQQLNLSQDPAKVIELLRAFQYDILQLLNEVNGDAVLNDKVRDKWFSSKAGGTKWVITADKPEDGSDSNYTVTSLTPAEQKWLLSLNQQQKLMNEALETLHGLQWKLYSTWWKKAYMSATAQQLKNNNTGITADQLLPFLDPKQANNLITPLIDQLNTINQLAKNLPQPIYTGGLNEQDAFLAGINKFAEERGIEDGKSLKALALPRYWKVNNPNVVISGIEASSVADPNSSLNIRSNNQLITAFTVNNTEITAATIASVIPALTNLPVLPAYIINLYQEFFLLDSSNAEAISKITGLALTDVLNVMQNQLPAAYKAILPENANAKVQQQIWNPLYMEWEVSYLSIPFEYIPDPKSGQRIRNWTFNGSDYELSGNIVGTGPLASIGGRSLLSPHLNITFGARLKDFIDKYGGTEKDLSDLYNEIEKIDNWKLLSQELVNLNEFKAQRDANAFRKPVQESINFNNQNIPLGQLMGFFGNDALPQYNSPSVAEGQVNSIPAIVIDNTNKYPFQAIRSGQFYFSRLIVYDKFGRMLDLIDRPDKQGTSAENFPLIVDEAYAVKNNLNPKIAAPFQLPPRLMQPARLDMLLVDQKNDNNVLGLAEDVNPICGWIISNHLDQSISVYAPDGSSMGEINLIQANASTSIANWSAPIHNSGINNISDISAISPNLGNFVNSLQGMNKDQFNSFIQVIDSTLWTTDPLGQRTDGNLSVFIGRPLALVRTQLQFSLDGEPISTCNWPTPVLPAISNPNIPDFTTSVFSIRFGDVETRQDGVIGYFEKNNYAQFNSVAAPLVQQNYVKQIGPLSGTDGNYIQLPFDNKTTETITLLVDPRASIHATTGILPLKELVIPVQFVNQPLANIEVAFRIGPFVSRKQPVIPVDNKQPEFAESINVLPLAEKNGTWSWWENNLINAGQQKQTETWNGYSIADASTQATLSANAAEILEGYLQFVTNLNSTKN